jgi:hypothetical protein
MKTFLSTLAITLAITFTAAPADALDDLAKCRVYNAKIKMNYAKCLELDKLLVEKGKAPKGTCESKRAPHRWGKLTSSLSPSWESTQTIAASG